MTGQTISHNRILDKLGEGGRRDVYEAGDTRLTRTVAVNLIQGGFGERDSALVTLEYRMF